MDPKGEDSGSDTLDQSLLKKCVVADDDSSSKQPDAAVREDNAAEEPSTEPGGNMSDSKDSPASPSPSPTQQLSTDSNTSDAILVVVKDKEDLPDDNTSSSGREDSRGFESKVRQISNDLKDTTLADESSLEKPDASDVSKESEASHTVAAGVTLEDVKNESDGYDSDRTITYESPSKKSSSSASEKKKSKKITKKVRFKVNQSKVCSDDEGDDEGDEDDDDDDEEADEEEEDDDDEDTLEGGRIKKLSIPLSFVSPHDEDDDNLSDEASAQLLGDEAEVEDPPPEGGVQNILGKLSRMGKIEYLFRWVDKPGIQWESEEVLSKMCPNLIKRYEELRANERDQEMRYVMRRKKIRQDLRNV